MNKAQQKFLAGIWETIWDRFTDDGYEIEIQDFIDEAVKCGMVDVVPFDPEVHTDNTGACEAGDTYYMIAKPGRAILRIARETAL